MDRLDAMEAYVRLVEVGTFSGAATALRVKQSTVSKWVAALEEELGVQLLERTTRSSRVTEAGQLFYGRAKEMLAAYADATALLHDESRALQGRIRVSVPVVFGQLHVVPHLVRFLRKHPEVEVDLAFADRYVKVVEEGFDVAIRVGAPADSSLVAHVLGTTRRLLVASPGYVKRAEDIAAPKDLAGHQCLAHGGDAPLQSWTFTREGRRRRVDVRGRFRANNSEAVRVMARAGVGVALLADWLVGGDVKAGRLVTLLKDWDPPPAPIHALRPAGRHVHPRVRAFIDFLHESLAPLRGEV